MANRWLDALRSGVRSVSRTASRSADGAVRATSGAPRPAAPGSTVTAVPRPAGHVALPDFDGPLVPAYAPDLDGDADPGEIVWTWVPFEDDPTQGKDRPVLVVGHDDPFLLGLMLTSKDHSRDAEREARHGRHWMDIGGGPWDAQRRPSEIRLDRVLRIDPGRVRREGSIMPRPLFDAVIGSLAEVKGW